MKHSAVLKFIAIFLAACALTVALGSALGIVMIAQAGLYDGDYAQWKEEYSASRAQRLATALAESYAARNRSNLSVEQLQWISWGNSWQVIGSWHDLAPDVWGYTIANNGTVRETTYARSMEQWDKHTFTMTVNYPIKVTSESNWSEMFHISGEPVYMRYDTSPVYAVTIWFAPNGITRYQGISMELYRQLMPLRNYLIYALAGCVLLFAACLVYLCFAAGKKQAGDIPRAGGLNRLPLELYAAGAAAVCLPVAIWTVEIVEEFLFHGEGIRWGWFALGTGLVFCGAVSIVGFLFALAAQAKTPGWYLLKNSLLGRCWGFLGKLLVRAFKGVRRLYGLLPVIWRYLLIALAMLALPAMFLFFCAVSDYDFFRFCWLVLFVGSLGADVAMVCYGAYAYGTILQGAEKMAAGNLFGKIETRYLWGAYRDCAENLNTLADVAVVAAKNQMKSERMKTELITNVSHDIKTPLTSIINYIDLLQKAETREQTADYLQVLDRQSQKLKKLIEDLMDMSKATTGNMTVDITRVDAVEAVNQALGEFSDKLEGQNLTVVFRQPEAPVSVLADGRLTWRVLSNLLSNAVKYALPGTRVYVDVMPLDDRVQLSMKNISREELNVSADELTERFVRGDASRNTEGSGLGLNIAKSLMELQKGTLELLVDGDLFKVTLTFPRA